MLKILQINACDSTASTGTVMRDIQDVCLHSGIECHIAYCETERSKADILNGYRIGTNLDHRIHQVLSHITHKQGYYSTLATKRFLRYMDRLRPDVVHLHNLHQNYVNIKILLAYLAERDIATVITLHDNWFFAGGCCLYVPLGCDKWQTGCTECKYFRPSKKVFEDRRKYFLAIPHLSVVGVSDWMSAQAARSFLAGRPIRTVRNGVRTDVFTPLTESGRTDVRKAFGIGPEQFVILGPASKWLQKSNIEDLQTIIGGLKEDETLVLYGCRAEHMRMKLGDKVKLIPFTPHKSLLSTYYSMADLFINCTHMDTCSFINIEAQACGTPVITFDNTGAAETVDGKCGFRVPTDDYGAMVREIGRVRQMGIDSEAPRQWVEERFSMRSNYDSYVKLYKGTV